MFAAIHVDKRDGYVFSVNAFNTYEGACNFIWQDMHDFLDYCHAGHDVKVKGEKGETMLEATVIVDGSPLATYKWSVENMGKRR